MGCFFKEMYEARKKKEEGTSWKERGRAHLAENMTQEIEDKLCFVCVCVCAVGHMSIFIQRIDTEVLICVRHPPGHWR